MPADSFLCSFIAPLELSFADYEMGGELSGSVEPGSRTDVRMFWPNDVLTSWETSLAVFPGFRFALKTALLLRLRQIAEKSTRLSVVNITEDSFLRALASVNDAMDGDPWLVLEKASVLGQIKRPDMESGESDGLLLLVDGWSGDVSPLRLFLSRHSCHVAPCSELYATEQKAGIGTEESSSDPPWPRFLGSVKNDDSNSLRRKNAIPLARLVLSCDPHCYESHKLWEMFVPLVMHAPSPNECSMLVRKMGSDCPSARAAGDAWVAFLCGTAASIPPPVGANPGVPRLLLTSVSGALLHLCSRAGVPRNALVAAGFLATCSLAAQRTVVDEKARASQPLTQADLLDLLRLYREHGGAPGARDEVELFEEICTSLKPLLSSAFPASSFRFGHLLIDQWLAAQFLAVEDNVSERTLRSAAERFPILKSVPGPNANQSLPFVYSSVCCSMTVWRGVLHFIGVLNGVYPLAYRLCAWSDSTNLATYQWLLQLKSQACSPLPKKTAIQRLAPPLFEYHVHGDLGRQVFWILCRVQAEVSVSNPSQLAEHGDDNPFPHFVRAVIANPRHAYDLAYVSDSLFCAALARLPDGLSIASHVADLCLEAGIARPWAVACYARILSALNTATLLPSGFLSHQCRTLSSSKSTSKRLLASAFLREHLWCLRAGILPANQGEFFSLFEAVLMGASDKSTFVRDDCLNTLSDMIWSSCDASLRSNPRVKKLVDEGLLGVVHMVRDLSGSSYDGASPLSASLPVLANPLSSSSNPLSSSMPLRSANLPATGGDQASSVAAMSKALTSLVIAAAELLLQASPLSIVPFLIKRRSGGDLSSCSLLTFVLRRVYELANVPMVDEQKFLWPGVLSVMGVSLDHAAPSEDLLCAINEFGSMHPAFLKMVLQQVLCWCVNLKDVLVAALRWKEPAMRREVMEASMCCPQGPEELCSILEEKNYAFSENEEIVLSALCSNQPDHYFMYRTPGHLCRAAKAVSTRPPLLSLVMVTLRSDFGQRGWWRRSRVDVALLLEICRDPEVRLSVLADVVGVLASLCCAVPGSWVKGLLLRLSSNSGAADFGVHGMLSVLAHLQVICSDGAVVEAPGERYGASDVLDVIRCIASREANVPSSLAHAVQVTAVKFLVSLPRVAELVAPVCFFVISVNSRAGKEEKQSSGLASEVAKASASFSNRALAVSFCCTVLTWIPQQQQLTLPEEEWDWVGYLAFWREGPSASVVAPLLALCAALVERELLATPTALDMAIPLVVSSNAFLCPFQREAASAVAKAVLRVFAKRNGGDVPEGEGAWIDAVCQEVQVRSEAIRPEEPGVVAAVKLLAQVVEGGWSGSKRLVALASRVASFDSLFTGMLENGCKLRVKEGSEGPWWNLSVVSEVLVLVQRLIRLELDVLGKQDKVARYAAVVMEIVSDGSVASPEVRKSAMRLVRVLPVPSIVFALRHLFCVNKQGKLSKWPFGKKSSNNVLPLLEVEAVPMSDFLAPVFRLFDRTTHLTEKMVALEVLALVTCPAVEAEFAFVEIDPSCVTRTESLMSDLLKSGSSATSAVLSALLVRHASFMLPHVWSVLPAALKVRSLGNKWVNFLRKHYNRDFPTRIVPPLLPRTETEATAAFRGFAAACAPTNKCESAVVYRTFGVVYDATCRSLRNVHNFGLCVEAVHCLFAALATDGPQATSEAKETVVLFALHLLGRFGSLRGSNGLALLGSSHLDPLRPVLDALPFGLGRRAWVVLQSATHALLY